MAERPTDDYGPQRPHTIHVPDDTWGFVYDLAARHRVSASSIFAELGADLMLWETDAQDELARKAARWMRPKGGAARADGDGDSA